MRELLDASPEAELVLVDIPIGLPWRECPTRPCDFEARKLLGTPRSSSVFPAPCRAAASASNVAEARANNVAELNKSLSEQAWGICRKIAETDELMRGDSRARKVVREVHPELCFWALNQWRPTAHPKRTKGGQRERVSVLMRHEPQTVALLATLAAQVNRKDARADDLLDALVANVTARSGTDVIEMVSGTPKHDECGLAMEMLYVAR